MLHKIPSNEIFNRHHGSIRFRSSTLINHRGTVFAVFLPFNSPIQLTSTKKRVIPTEGRRRRPQWRNPQLLLRCSLRLLRTPHLDHSASTEEGKELKTEN